MKMIAMMALLLAGQVGLASLVERHSQIAKYESNLENTVVLPMNFAEDLIIDDSQLELLEGKEIYLVELVYTQFRTSESFDQDALNKERVEELKLKIPTVESSEATWIYVEQTGAKSRNVARAYFHGFVIHYQDEMDYQSLKDFFSDFQSPQETQRMSAENGGELLAKSGTKITILPNSVTYADGTPVQGEFELKLQEFRDPADIAFSGIPMTYHASDGEYNFASVGMYELNATQDGKQLKLTNEAQVDFIVNEKREDVGYYEMDEDGKWKKLQDVDFDATTDDSNIEEEVNEVVSLSTSATDNSINDNMAYYNSSEIALLQGTYKMGSREIKIEVDGDKSIFKMNEKAWKSYEKALSNLDTLDRIVVEEAKKSRKITVDNRNNYYLYNAIANPNGARAAKVRLGKMFSVEASVGSGWISGGNVVMSEEQKARMKKVNETAKVMNTMNQSLRASGFGIYNCDQTYRMQEPVAYQPIYYDKETGEEIDEKYMVQVLDLKMNGSLSYGPNYINMSRTSKSAVLLFTMDKEIYLLSSEDVAALDRNQTYQEFQMTNLTGKVSNASGLRPYLN